MQVRSGSDNRGPARRRGDNLEFQQTHPTIPSRLSQRNTCRRRERGRTAEQARDKGLTIGAVKFRNRIKGYPQWHRSQEEDRLRDVVDFRTVEGMDKGEAG